MIKSYFIKRMSSMFENTYDFEERKKESKSIMLKFPDRIPVIIEKSAKCNCDRLPKTKYLVPKDFSVGKLVLLVKRKLLMGPEHCIFLYVNDVLPPPSMLVSELYNLYVKKDGFLYISYAQEGTFG